MPWGRLDDRANENEKLLVLSDAAWRLWGCGLIYCQNKLTDGYIPAPIIITFGVKARDLKKVVAELLSVLVPGKGPLWHEAPGGYRVHDYLDWNDSRDKILGRRSAAKTRQQKHRAGQSHGVGHGERSQVVTPLVTRDVIRDERCDARGTYQRSPEYSGSTYHEERTREYGAGRAGAHTPPVEDRLRPTVWTVGLAIAHRVIEDDPENTQGWESELKARMLNQGIDANDRGPHGDKPKFVVRVLDACLAQRRFRKGDGGVIAWRYRHAARQERKAARRAS